MAIGPVNCTAACRWQPVEERRGTAFQAVNPAEKSHGQDAHATFSAGCLRPSSGEKIGRRRPSRHGMGRTRFGHNDPHDRIVRRDPIRQKDRVDLLLAIHLDDDRSILRRQVHRFPQADTIGLHVRERKSLLSQDESEAHLGRISIRAGL